MTPTESETKLAAKVKLVAEELHSRNWTRSRDISERVAEAIVAKLSGLEGSRVERAVAFIDRCLDGGKHGALEKLRAILTAQDSSAGSPSAASASLEQAHPPAQGSAGAPAPGAPVPPKKSASPSEPLLIASCVSNGGAQANLEKAARRGRTSPPPFPVPNEDARAALAWLHAGGHRNSGTLRDYIDQQEAKDPSAGSAEAKARDWSESQSVEPGGRSSPPPAEVKPSERIAELCQAGRPVDLAIVAYLDEQHARGRKP